MDIIKLFYAFMALVGGVFYIAVSSIALECYEKNPSMKTDKQTNYNFIIANIVMAGLSILSSLFSMYSIANSPY